MEVERLVKSFLFDCFSSSSSLPGSDRDRLARRNVTSEMGPERVVHCHRRSIISN